ncbi:MAG: hypothetical protein AAFU71_11120 [Cyanobacteria bacterium J06632_22]
MMIDNNGRENTGYERPSGTRSSGAARAGAYDYDVNVIMGIAVFNLDGLPQEYFITPDNRDTAWVQMVFQSLGLQALTAEALGAQSLKYTIVQTRDGDAVIIRTVERFLALFVKRSRPQMIPSVEPEWIDWVCQFEAKALRSHPHFRAA